MIHVLCSDSKHPVFPALEQFCSERGYSLFTKLPEVTGGEILFLVSCTEFIKKEVRDRYKRVLVIHESDLPQGRGWSPLAWQVLNGAKEITVSIIEASEKIDEGRVLCKKSVSLDGGELYDEIHSKTFEVKKQLIDYALEHDETKDQVGIPTYFKRRTPEMSQVDPYKTIASQFNLLRICEPRFPAFFFMNGNKYEVTVRKA